MISEQVHRTPGTAVDFGVLLEQGRPSELTKGFCDAMQAQGWDHPFVMGRAAGFVGSLVMPLVFLRDNGEIALSEDVLLENFDLGTLESLAWDREAMWKDGVKRYAGYFEATYGVAWTRIVKPLQAWLQALPGYDISKLGEQGVKAAEQHGAVTRPLVRLITVH